MDDTEIDPTVSLDTDEFNIDSASQWYDLLVGAHDIGSRHRHLQLLCEYVVDTHQSDAIDDVHCANNLTYDLETQYRPETAFEHYTTTRSSIKPNSVDSYVQGHYYDKTQFTNEERTSLVDPLASGGPSLGPQALTTIPVLIRTEGELSISPYNISTEFHVVVTPQEHATADST